MKGVIDHDERCRGQVHLVEPQMLRGTKLFTRYPSSNLAARIDMAAVGVPATGAGIDVLVLCGPDSGGDWAMASVEDLTWDQTDSFGGDLIAFRKNGHAGQRRLVLRPTDNYRKPDGSEFNIQCDATQDGAPLQCEVMMKLSDLVYVSYVYLADPGLSKWREIDAVVRQIGFIKESE